MTSLSEFTEWIHKHPIRALLTIGITSYLGKYLLIASAYDGKYRLVVCLFCPLVCILFVPYIFTFGYGIFVVFKYKNIVLFPSVIIVFLLAFHLPLPPLPKGEAAKHFFEHRDRYKYIVEQARNENLEKNAMLFRNVYVVNTDPLAIVFGPKNMYPAVIVYSEDEAYLEHIDVCNGDGSVYDQLDDHWWLCFIDWL